MSAVLDQVLSQARRSEADAEAAYQKLVVDLADDSEVDAASVIATIEASGRTLTQLGADVERLVARRLAAETLAFLPDLRRERETCAASVAELERERTRVLADLDRKLGVAKRALRDADAELRRCDDARGVLTSTADPAFLAKRDHLLSERGAAEHAVREAAAGLKDAQAFAANPTVEVVAPGDEWDRGSAMMAASAGRVRTGPPVRTE